MEIFMTIGILLALCIRLAHFLYDFDGLFTVVRAGLFKDEGQTEVLTQIVLYLIIPCVILRCDFRSITRRNGCGAAGCVCGFALLMQVVLLLRFQLLDGCFPFGCG